MKQHGGKEGQYLGQEGLPLHVDGVRCCRVLRIGAHGGTRGFVALRYSGQSSWLPRENQSQQLRRRRHLAAGHAIGRTQRRRPGLEACHTNQAVCRL